MNGPKIYFTIPLFGGIPITQTTVSSFAVMLLLCIAGIVLGSNLQKRPSRRQVLVEKGVTMLYGMVEDTMGKHNPIGHLISGHCSCLPFSVPTSE
ncbi:hypothetical protein [Gemmiger qucibialis]|uniref:hypothetical protein n=1 Tax=Gemmiger qucibialis TaxID=2997294 RepID=UPI0022E42568|nr:hypothetical protein [Gemmiger qucibialis]